MMSRLIRHSFFCCLLLLFALPSARAAELDSGFGNDGRVVVELGVYGDRANAVVVQPDGRIVVGGSSSGPADLDFLLFRLLPDGSLDPDFNYDGTVITAVGRADDEILALALQPDGKILAAGYSSNETDRDFALVRLNSDGSPDIDFGLDGIVLTPVGNSDDEITGMALAPDGSIVVTGTARGTAGRVVVLGRYLADGTLDNSFADNGFSFVGVGEEAQPDSVVVLPDGRILVSGSYSEQGRTGLMLVGFTNDGRLDTDFGVNGVAVPSDSRVFSEGYGMYLNTDGTLLVAGSVGEEGRRDAALFRFLEDGSPDAGFEDNGVLVTAVSAEDDVLFDVTVTGDTIAAGGFSTASGVREFLFITYEHAGINEVRTQEDSEAGSSPLQIGELRVEDSFDTYRTDAQSADLLVDVLTTRFSGEDDIATALADVDEAGVVAVGVSSQGERTSAAVSKYVPASSSLKISKLSVGSPYIITGEPYDVTRTTAIIPVTLFASIGAVTERGIVFSILPNPTLQDGDDNGDDNDTIPPQITNTTPGSFDEGKTVTLSIKTKEEATCKYNKDTDVAYASMSNYFLGLNTIDHSASLDGLAATSYTYYARCVDRAGNESSNGTKITFSVEPATLILSKKILNGVGNFLVSSAIAEQTTVSGTTTATTNRGTLFDPYSGDDFVEEGNTQEGSGVEPFHSRLEKLKPGTFYYARAYAVINGTTCYGNQVGFTTGDSCFVATAAFGSIFHPYVKILRDFRDRFLLGNPVGRAFVALYYTYSPPVADIIAADFRLRLLVCLLLLPLVGMAWLVLQLGPAGLLVVFPVVAGSWYVLGSGVRRTVQ
jgi:uncharacterized delta-60 repeat protein